MTTVSCSACVYTCYHYIKDSPDFAWRAEMRKDEDQQARAGGGPGRHGARARGAGLGRGPGPGTALAHDSPARACAPPRACPAPARLHARLRPAGATNSRRPSAARPPTHPLVRAERVPQGPRARAHGQLLLPQDRAVARPLRAGRPQRQGLPHGGRVLLLARARPAGRGGRRVGSERPAFIPPAHRCTLAPTAALLPPSTLACPRRPSSAKPPAPGLSPGGWRRRVAGAHRSLKARAPPPRRRPLSLRRARSFGRRQPVPAAAGWRCLGWQPRRSSTTAAPFVTHVPCP